MILKLFFGPRCESCHKFAAHIKICDFCLKNNISKVRNIYRFYRHSGGNNNLCRICGKPVCKDAHSFCYKCVPMHPDDTHMNDSCPPSADPSNGWWSKAIRSGGWDVGENIVTIINCTHCGGLLLITTNPYDKNSSETDINYVLAYRYYKKGHKKPICNPFYCTGEAEDKLNREQQICDHEFITILEPDTKTYERHLARIMQNNGTKEWLDWDKAAIHQMAYEMSTTKYIIKWCWKCGKKESFTTEVT